MPGHVGLDIEMLFAPFGGCRIIGLAVSGGPDSLALMLLAAQWAAGRDVKLIVYSVDHGLRSEAADEAAMVAREASKLGLEARILRWEGDKPASGLQAAARSARYRLLAAARAADGAELVLTAHHLGDQAETVLMRMAHGSGIDGLAGMRAVSFVEGCKIARPLLDVPPLQLRAVVDAAGLVPAADPGNEDPGYERVRWRQFQPMLDAMGLTIERLGTLARRMDDASDLVDSAVDAEYRDLVHPVTGAHFEIAHGRFAALNPLVGTRLLGQVLELVSDDRRSPPLAPLEALQQRLQRFSPLPTATLHGCLIASDGETISVKRESPRSAARKAQEKATSH